MRVRQLVLAAPGTFYDIAICGRSLFPQVRLPAQRIARAGLGWFHGLGYKILPLARGIGTHVRFHSGESEMSPMG